MVADLSELMRRLSMRIRSREEWERVRARGHVRWIVWKGVPGFGLPVYLVTLLVLYVFGSFPSEIDWTATLASAALAALGGYVVADLEWHKAENRFG